MNRLMGIGTAAMLSVAVTGFAAAQETANQPNSPQSSGQQTASEANVQQSSPSPSAQAQQNQPQTQQQSQTAQEEENAAIVRQNQNNLLITEQNAAREKETHNTAESGTVQNAVTAAAGAAQTETAVKEAQEQNAQSAANGGPNGNASSPNEQAALSPQALPPPYTSAEALAPKPLMQGATIIDAKGNEIGKVAQLTQNGDVVVALAGNGGKNVAIPAWRIVQTPNGEARAMMSADEVANMPSVAQSSQGTAQQHG